MAEAEPATDERIGMMEQRIRSVAHLPGVSTANNEDAPISIGEFRSLIARINAEVRARKAAERLLDVFEGDPHKRIKALETELAQAKERMDTQLRRANGYQDELGRLASIAKDQHEIIVELRGRLAAAETWVYENCGATEEESIDRMASFQGFLIAHGKPSSEEGGDAQG